MPRRSNRISLSHGSPGMQRSVLAHHFGHGRKKPKAYVQAALHSDETPGLLVLHYLAELLDQADRNNQISGEIIVVPFSNPIGLGQFINRRHSGSGDFSGGGNFNRNWPDLSTEVSMDVGSLLGEDPEKNANIIRDSLQRIIKERPTDCEFDSLRNTLLAMALDCDLVLDLHCDTGDALVHMFAHQEFEAELKPLSAYLGCRSVFLGQAVGTTFQGSCAAPWLGLRQSHPNCPIPLGCISATIELRGQSDVNEKLAKKDARAIFQALQQQGFILGPHDEIPMPLCSPTMENTFEVLRAPITGVLSYCVSLGDEVKTGDLIAWIIDVDAEDIAQSKYPVRAGTDGFVLATNLMKYAMAGWSIGKIAGTQPLEDDQIIEGGAFLPT